MAGGVICTRTSPDRRDLARKMRPEDKRKAPPAGDALRAPHHRQRSQHVRHRLSLRGMATPPRSTLPFHAVRRHAMKNFTTRRFSTRLLPPLWQQSFACVRSPQRNRRNCVLRRLAARCREGLRGQTRQPRRLEEWKGGSANIHDLEIRPSNTSSDGPADHQQPRADRDGPRLRIRPHPLHNLASRQLENNAATMEALEGDALT